MLRLLARWMVAVAASTLALGWAAIHGRDEGTWTCRVCCLAEERTRYFGITLARGEMQASERESEVSGTFHAWGETGLGLEHEHDWAPSGCHARGWTTVACSESISSSAFYGSLPRLPDPELARALASRVAAADPVRRREMLDDFYRRPGPFAAIAFGEPPLEPGFAGEVEAWLAEHPLWR